MSTPRKIPPGRIPVVIYDKAELHNDFVRKMRQMDHRYYLKLKKDESLIMLAHSLVFDGRFYGAEWMLE